MLKSIFTQLIILLIAIIAVGCGSGEERPQTSKTEGTVTFDGKPLEAASVSFIPESGRPASGFTDASGRFVLTTFGSEDGAIVGQHTVIISKVKSEAKDQNDIYAKQKSVIPEKYSDIKKTELTATINSDGANDIKLDLKK